MRRLLAFLSRWLDRRIDRRIQLAQIRAAERHRRSVRGTYRQWMDENNVYSPKQIEEAFIGYEEGVR